MKFPSKTKPRNNIPYWKVLLTKQQIDDELTILKRFLFCSKLLFLIKKLENLPLLYHIPIK